MAVVENLHFGKDGVIRAVEIRIAKSYLEQAIQLLYPMKIHCNTVRNTNVKEFRPSRPKRTRASVAKLKIRDIQQKDDDI